VRKRGFVVLGIALLLVAAFLVEAVLTPKSATLNETPPVEPEGFLSPSWVAAGVEGEQVFLHWRSVPGALAYTLWRSGDPDSGYRVIHMGRDTTYADQDGLVHGQLYCYLLTATDPEFDESGLSPEKCVEFGDGEDDDSR